MTLQVEALELHRARDVFKCFGICSGGLKRERRDEELEGGGWWVVDGWWRLTGQFLKHNVNINV